MAAYRISPQAEQEIRGILVWTHAEFGEKARRRYEALLARAIRDVAESPARAGSHARPEIAVLARTFHLRHGRDRVPRPVGRVRKPRHFLLYRTSDEGTIEIGRVLHDGMDLDRQLPEDYRVDQQDER
jgi:toxin ParE1/3/4